MKSLLPSGVMLLAVIAAPVQELNPLESGSEPLRALAIASAGGNSVLGVLQEFRAVANTMRGRS